MSQHVETNTKTFTAGAAIAKYLRVHLSSGKLAASGITQREIGTIEDASFADGDVRAVRLASAAGTCKMVASAAISQGALVYTAASGKVGPSASTAFVIGTALEAAAADGDVIEVVRIGTGDTAVP